jgi:hypothetical protein
MSKTTAALPGRLQIGEYDFPLRVVPKEHPVLNEEEGDRSDGATQVNHENQYYGIWIAAHLSTRRRFGVVWHEVTHALNWVAGLGAIDENDNEATVEEEDIAEEHGVYWPQLLLENPQFARWVTYMLSRIHAEQKAHTDADRQEPTTPRDTGHTDEAGSPAGPSAVGGAVRGDEKA